MTEENVPAFLFAPKPPGSPDLTIVQVRRWERGQGVAFLAGCSDCESGVSS